MSAPRRAPSIPRAQGFPTERGCDDDPYDALSSEASRYVIPDSDDWGSGELCPDGGACSGLITVEVIERYGWFRITHLAIEAGHGWPPWDGGAAVGGAACQRVLLVVGWWSVRARVRRFPVAPVVVTGTQPAARREVPGSVAGCG